MPDNNRHVPVQVLLDESSRYAHIDLEHDHMVVFYDEATDPLALHDLIRLAIKKGYPWMAYHWFDTDLDRDVAVFERNNHASVVQPVPVLHEVREGLAVEQGPEGPIVGSDVAPGGISGPRSDRADQPATLPGNATEGASA